MESLKLIRREFGNLSGATTWVVVLSSFARCHFDLNRLFTPAGVPVQSLLRSVFENTMWAIADLGKFQWCFMIVLVNVNQVQYGSGDKNNLSSYCRDYEPVWSVSREFGFEWSGGSFGQGVAYHLLQVSLLEFGLVGQIRGWGGKGLAKVVWISTGIRS